MHLPGQRAHGITILLMLSTLVIVKRLATGSISENKPKDYLRVRLTKLFNLFFLLVVNPAAAILLISRQLETVDATHLAMGSPWPVVGLEMPGLVLYVMGFVLMALALIRLGSNYQLGGSTPRAADEMVTDGPYRLARERIKRLSEKLLANYSDHYAGWSLYLFFYQVWQGAERISHRC